MSQEPLSLPVKQQAFAFFFDVDGTLAAIKPTPDQVTIPEAVITALNRLTSICHGAVAVVSGRPIRELEALVAPLNMPMAGVHGAELKIPGKPRISKQLPGTAFASLRHQLTEALTQYPGVKLEDKGIALALHYRQATQHAESILSLAQRMTHDYPQLVLQQGKCVVELKPDGCDKGAAIRELMACTPFAGRCPVFIGDDLTDEAGFTVVNEYDGMSIKVGPGDSAAHYRLTDVDAVHQWLIGMEY